MNISLVVFDIAGTTVEDADAVNTCIREALSAAGIHATRDEVNCVMGLPKPVAIAKLVEQSGRTDFGARDVQIIHDDFVARTMRHYQHSPDVRAVAGADKVFEMLQQAGIKVALDTGFSREITEVILDRVGWSSCRWIDASICSDEVARGRPHPDMIRELMLRCGIRDPVEVAKVGDTPADLQEGQSAGCGLVVGVTGGTHTRRELEVHPHTHLVDTIRDLPVILGLS